MFFLSQLPDIKIFRGQQTSSTRLENDSRNRYRKVVHSDKIFPLKICNLRDFSRNFTFHITTQQPSNLQFMEIFYQHEDIVKKKLCKIFSHLAKGGKILIKIIFFNFYIKY